ncbi:GNAT family N-acetyltransferase [Noviluteimonas gilva]|uniref:GNAT family N-acetyltransferase n=1 Tax=Noviluteimonas gilva TaxID=2682097 RepID=A0A7C9HVV5_9GAMM|nr:GNAT family N-acetyltransferase [Lysobacter gilvus]MUV14738.1 GNAT family N-acetyltransferase [Lysobacter gilvus]
MIAIDDAAFPEDLATVRALFREYASGLEVDLDFQDFDAELAALPGKYARPGGRVLLAKDGERVLGCVCLRPLSADDCEMKRLYVRPDARGLRLGRRLVERLCDEAKDSGYSRMFLDTLPSMATAQQLYADIGFVPTQAYVFNPVPGTKYLRRDL